MSSSSSSTARSCAPQTGRPTARTSSPAARRACCGSMTSTGRRRSLPCSRVTRPTRSSRWSSTLAPTRPPSSSPVVTTRPSGYGTRAPHPRFVSSASMAASTQSRSHEINAPPPSPRAIRFPSGTWDLTSARSATPYRSSRPTVTVSTAPLCTRSARPSSRRAVTSGSMCTTSRPARSYSATRGTMAPSTACDSHRAATPTPRAATTAPSGYGRMPMARRPAATLRLTKRA
mmetsp:Transcript_72238/g.174377  ORF Transcript_72238/g.174377 Transcript_72238/m.174377 type:complete len:231 (-) Transcript_72238:98-790(-)